MYNEFFSKFEKVPRGTPGGLFSVWTFFHKISPTSVSIQNLRFALKAAILWMHSAMFSYIVSYGDKSLLDFPLLTFK